jgi:hypothetical protein
MTSTSQDAAYPPIDTTRVTAPEASGWQEVESAVYWPLGWVAVAVGVLFFLVGVIGILTIGQRMPGDTARVIARVILGAFALIGLAIMPTSLARVFWPVRVRHAGPGVLPDVPREPVVVEGAVVNGRLGLELVEDSDGWQLRPAVRQWKNDQRLLFGFGVPFLILFAGGASLGFHGTIPGWAPAILCGTAVTLLCGGTVFGLIALMMRAGHRRLSSLSIPRNGGDLVLDAAVDPDPQQMNLSDGLQWAFGANPSRRQMAIPRPTVQAVQLCPWKVVVRNRSNATQIAWAVQGVLVVANPSKDKSVRLPLLLTGDFSGAARLMQRLAATLAVPYLFGADAAGVEAEKVRAQSRPPLRAGGTQS